MESLPAIVSVNRATIFLWSSSPSSALSVAHTRDVGARPAARAVSCSAVKDSVFYSLEKNEIFNSTEVIQWESGKCFNSIAAAQGIRIRRRCRTRYPSEGRGADTVVPRNTLEQIIWDKEVEVFQRKATMPLQKVMESAQHAPPPRDFVGALVAAHRCKNAPALIAEVRTASPGMGVLREHFNPVETARAYEKNGADCLSIVTDEKHFQGSFEDLEAVRNSGVKCPLLCKEFIIDISQIYHARSKGADAILLIASVLPDLDIKYMLHICDSIGMTALIQVHDEREFDRVLKIDGVQVIGINNHDLDTFQVDMENTMMLLETRGDIIREKGILVVAESEMLTPEDVARVHNAGVYTVLVGESLLTKEYPVLANTRLCGKILEH